MKSFKKRLKMKEEEILKERYGKSGGWKLPDGYFENLYKEVESKLPEYPEKPKEVDMTVWQRIKPYAYLAAMFAGIWLMMNIFHRVSGEATLSMDNLPEQIAMAMVESDESDIYMMSESMSDYMVEEEIIKEYDTIEEFAKDFGFEITADESDM